MKNKLTEGLKGMKKFWKHEKKEKIKIADEVDYGVIQEKLVCFKVTEARVFVYLIVEGFDVVERTSSVCFRDKLPLYEIPKEKLEEHYMLFEKSGYDIKVSFEEEVTENE